MTPRPCLDGLLVAGTTKRFLKFVARRGSTSGAGLTAQHQGCHQHCSNGAAFRDLRINVAEMGAGQRGARLPTITHFTRRAPAASIARSVALLILALFLSLYPHHIITMTVAPPAAVYRTRLVEAGALSLASSQTCHKTPVKSEGVTSRFTTRKSSPVSPYTSHGIPNR